MDLSIASVNAFSHGMSAQGRTSGQTDASRAAGQPITSDTDSRDTSASETLTERPARETQQTSRLPPEEQKQLAELQQRDREVKAHELAHKSAGGRYVTSGSFTYQTGPDGRRYAIGGEVTIDSSAGSTPEETLRKAEMIRRAALAPADPSPQDHRVASQAAMMAAEARGEISAEQRQALQQQREGRETQQGEESESEPAIPRLNQRAVDSFTAVAVTSLQSQPDPIDEIV